MNNNNFSINRLHHFVLRQLTLNTYPALIAYGAVFGLLLIISLLTAYFNAGHIDNLKGLYLTVFMAGGFIFTSMIFSEMHTPQKSYAYLTLPVSASEKLIGSWLLSSPVFIVVFSVSIFIIGLISGAVANRPQFSMELFDHDYFIVVAVYLVTQTIFFLGAVYFRKNNFLKTLLALFALAAVLSAYSGLIFWILFGNNMEGMNENVSFGTFKGTIEFLAEQVIPFIFWYLLGPFMLVVSYFRLKERQV